MKSKIILISILLINFARASTVLLDITIDSNNQMFHDKFLQPLWGRNVPPHPGSDSVEFGYYSNSTSQNPFAGDWIILDRLVMGSNAEINVSFQAIYGANNHILPEIGQQVAIRFYDGNSSSNIPQYQALNYNAISDPGWQWVEPTSKSDAINNPVNDLNLIVSANTIAQSHIDGAFIALIPIPEPSSALLLALSSVVLLMRRNRP